MTTPGTVKRAYAEDMSPDATDAQLATQVEKACQELEVDGITQLDRIILPTQLETMQKSFESRLQALRWNNMDGYERTERFRHMVEDVLTVISFGATIRDASGVACADLWKNDCRS